jgi:hypothetical protein
MHPENLQRVKNTADKDAYDSTSTEELIDMEAKQTPEDC